MAHTVCVHVGIINEHDTFLYLADFCTEEMARWFVTNWLEYSPLSILKYRDVVYYTGI
jgi:hypothetical protein